MIKYRITKYNPKYRNEFGHFLKKDWISHSDIGKIYSGRLFTLEEYLKTEKEYIRTIFNILNFFNVLKLEVKELELQFSIEKMNKLLNFKELQLDNQDICLIKNLKNGKLFSVNELEKIIKLILRECFWCKLVSKDPKCVIEFGYDYYMYTTVISELPQVMINNAEKQKIFVEQVLIVL